jgi:hypothetical protein
LIYRGELWRLACLPMGWSGSAYYFCKLTQAFINYLRRTPTPMTTNHAKPYKTSRRFLPSHSLGAQYVKLDADLRISALFSTPSILSVHD